MRRWLGLWVALLLLFQALAAPGTGTDPTPTYRERLEVAWRLVHDLYYDRTFGGVDWDGIRQTYLRRASTVSSWNELYDLIDEMYLEIGDGHTRFLSPQAAAGLLGEGACYPVPYPEVWQEPAPPVQAGEGKAGALGAWAPPEARRMGDILYLRLPDLVSEEAYATLRRAIAAQTGVRGYILDLRGNPGGLALRMAQVASLFMRGWPWRLVVRGSAAMPQPTIPFWGKPEASAPLAVLIDGGVNSAAEGLAGALKDAGRARLFGQPTAGNTEIVLPYCFPEGAVALVAAGVLAPLSGPTWEGRGVQPDIFVEPESALDAAIDYLRSR